MWSVSDAKAHLSEVLKLARSGEPQTIGSQNPCIVIALADYEKFIEMSEREHDGLWLMNATSKLDIDIQLPSRLDDRNDPIFEI
jgi:prevent-host-death family protein